MSINIENLKVNTDLSNDIVIFGIREFQLDIYLIFIDLIVLFFIVVILWFIIYNIIKLKKSIDWKKIKKRIFILLGIAILFSLIIYINILISWTLKYTI